MSARKLGLRSQIGVSTLAIIRSDGTRREGDDVRSIALTVALATSNSFLIPAHQVNALIMGPGSYKVADFFRAGSIMTVLMVILNIFY